MTASDQLTEVVTRAYVAWVELSDTHPDLVLRRDDSLFIAEQIVAAGYRIVYKDQINTVFVRVAGALPPPSARQTE